MNLNAFDYLILLKRGRKKKNNHKYLITACKKKSRFDTCRDCMQGNKVKSQQVWKEKGMNVMLIST